MKYTVFFEQINRTNVQVSAGSEEQARRKAIKFYETIREIPTTYVQKGWLVPSDGEDRAGEPC